MAMIKIGDRTDVTIVDDDANIRLLVKEILQSTANFNFAGGFSNATEALATLPVLHPDLTLMDIRLPDINGIECSKQLKERLPDLKIIIITGIRDPICVEDSLSAGAVAFLIKPFARDQLLATLKCAVHAPRQINPRSQEADNINPLKNKTTPSLSLREKEVLKYLAAGLLYKEISDKMSISYAAVHKCQHNIFRKLGIANRSEAIRMWLGGSTC